MAIRIPVVISQNEIRKGSVADYEEQLITRLILENGLDATIIADLKSIALDTTDHLCIEGLKGDFAIATWESAQYVCEHLHRLGIPSIEIVPVDGSPRFVSSASNDTVFKKVFFVHLALANSLENTLRTLRELRDARSTPVFSIGGVTRKLPNLVPNVVEIKPEVSKIPSTRTELGTESTSRMAVTVEEDVDFPNIDQLMNDLDKFEM